MPNKMALVNYEKCHPEKCDSGVCAAALACSHGLLRQEAPFEIPMTYKLAHEPETADLATTESMHGAGSPQAQKIMIERETDMDAKQRFARSIAGIDKREDPLA
jgi:hypothetical protein